MSHSVLKVYMTDTFFIYSIKSPRCDFPSPCFDVPKALNFTSGGVQDRETKNDLDIISGLQASRKTDFSDIFLFFYKQRTIVPFLSELISSQEND